MPKYTDCVGKLATRDPVPRTTPVPNRRDLPPGFLPRSRAKRTTRASRELFYLDGNASIAVEIDGDGAAVQAEATRRLFTIRSRTEGYRGVWKRRHVGGRPGGKRFLANQLGEEATVQTPMTVITNSRATLRWHRELTRLAPRRKGLQQ